MVTEERRRIRDQARVAAANHRAAVADEIERKRLYLESRNEEVADRNEELAETDAALRSVLEVSLAEDWRVDYEALKRRDRPAVFDAAGYDGEWPVPQEASYMPRAPGVLAKTFRAEKTQARQEALVAVARTRFQEALLERESKEQERQQILAQRQLDYSKYAAALESEVNGHNASVDARRLAYEAGEPGAVVDHLAFAFEQEMWPEGFPEVINLAFVPESKQLVIEREVPTLEVVPGAAGYRYVRARDEITHSARPASQRKALYVDMVAQVVLRTIHVALAADTSNVVQTVVLNCLVDTIDRSTGAPVRPCLVSVRVGREGFTSIELSKVDAIACLHGLNAHVSRDPTELQPIRPIVDFNMVDHRFIEGSDVLGELEERPNLMELTPNEFEGLITNLFQKMGLETKLTQASRDGGVDCVAWDMRPVVGGKVIVQAKRYKNTVGVSAVRDLFGTVHNEGAAKGILITTSGYGTSSFEFAKNKPLELLDGSNLLYLLEEHTGVRARIEVPDDWVDPIPD
jgi:restriction system protein